MGLWEECRDVALRTSSGALATMVFTSGEAYLFVNCATKNFN
jgi:hypothetical protein